MIAAGSLFLADEFIRNFFRGNSEGILVALCLWAIERHLDGRRRDAFLLGLGAALLRPEVWPFIALYGLFLMATDRRVRRRRSWSAADSGFVLWFVPEYLGTGDFLRAAARARQPNPDSAAFATTRSSRSSTAASVLSLPVYVGGLSRSGCRLVRRDGLYLAMAAIGDRPDGRRGRHDPGRLCGQPTLRRAARRARLRARGRGLGMARPGRPPRASASSPRARSPC